jgi:hypothetical protein
LSKRHSYFTSNDVLGGFVKNNINFRFSIMVMRRFV